MAAGPEGGNLPMTLFGMPIHLVKGTALKDDEVIVFGTLGEYVTQEELFRLLTRRAALLIVDLEEGDMTVDVLVDNRYVQTPEEEGETEEQPIDGMQLMKDLLMKANRLEIEPAAYKNQGESLQRKLDAARAALRKLEWQACYQYSEGFWRCPECLGRKDRGHDDDCALQAAL